MAEILADSYLEKYGLDQEVREPIERYFGEVLNDAATDDVLNETFLNLQARLWLHPQHRDARALNLLNEVTSDMMEPLFREKSDDPARQARYDVVKTHHLAVDVMSVHGFTDPFTNELNDEELDANLVASRQQFAEQDLSTVSRGDIAVTLIDLQQKEGRRRCFLSTVFGSLAEQTRAVAEGLLEVNRGVDAEFFTLVADGYQAAAEKSIGATDPIVIQLG